MEIFLLSDTKDPNPKLKAKITEKVLEHRGKVAYVSSSPQDKERVWFHNTEKEYQNFNPKLEFLSDVLKIQAGKII